MSAMHIEKHRAMTKPGGTRSPRLTQAAERCSFPTKQSRIGRTGLPVSYVAQLWGSAIAGAAIAWGVKLALPSLHPIVTAALVLAPYGVVFLAMTLLLRIPEASSSLARILRR